MPTHVLTALLLGVSGQHRLAVVLAATGAVLLGLGSVRQHRAVQQAVALEGRGSRQSLQAFWRMVRSPAWLAGSLQGLAGGSLHIVALTLAPIVLVQPIGVLAVPVAGAATALRDRRRPGLRQVLGTLLSVGSVAALAVLLLVPSGANVVVLPRVSTVAITVAVAVLAALVVVRAGHGLPPLMRCCVLAVTAATLFGLGSVLVRTSGTIFGGGAPSGDRPLFVTALIGIAVVLPIGGWVMQRAYISGSPQVVVCCMTLADPLTAVIGGRLMLQDGAAIGSATLFAAIGCALLAGAGVVLLSSQDRARRRHELPSEPDAGWGPDPRAIVLDRKVDAQ